MWSAITANAKPVMRNPPNLLLLYGGQGRGRTLDNAWDFFCGRMIPRKLTSHPVQKQPFSSAGGKIKIDGDSFVQLVSKIAIFFIGDKFSCYIFVTMK